MIKLLKGFSQKWFLIGLFALALVGSLLGMYLFENDFIDQLFREKKPAKPPVVVKNEGEEEGTAFQRTISEEKLNSLVDGLTLEEKIGQMLIISFLNTEPSQEVQDFLREKHPGGVLLTNSNFISLNQLRKLTTGLQQLATYQEIPLFVAVSQEGGLINPLVKELTVFPGNMAVGATKSPEYAYRFGRVTGQELKGLGINLNLAPVLDLATQSSNPVVGTRSFSENSQVAALLGGRYIAGLQNTGVAAGAKHFPGQGEVLTNPKESLPILAFKRDDLEMRELIPFKEAIQQDVAAIVMSHVLFPEIDPRYPASFSDKFIRELLRSKEGMGFEGLVITADLAMKSIANNPGTVPAAVQAVKAGADLVIVTGDLQNQQNVYQALLKAVQRGEIKESQINDSVKRILRAKFRYAIVYPEKEAELFHRIASKRHQKRAQQIAQQSITVVKDEQDALPVAAEEKVLLLAPTELPGGGDTRYLASLLTKYYPNLSYQEFVNYRSAEEKQALKSLVQKHSTIIACTYNAGPNQATLVKDLMNVQNKKIIVVALGNPYDLELFPQVNTFIATYSYRKISLEALARVIAGRIERDQELGTLPVTLRINP